MRRDFPYYDLFNNRIIQLEETGTLSRLRQKWIHNRQNSLDHICGQKSQSNQQQVSWKNVTDIFWLLCGGILFCIVVFIFEQCNAVRVRFSSTFWTRINSCYLLSTSMCKSEDLPLSWYIFNPKFSFPSFDTSEMQFAMQINLDLTYIMPIFTRDKTTL